VRALFKTVLDCLDDSNTPSLVCLMAANITHEVLAKPDLREYVQQQMSMLVERIVVRLSADKEGYLIDERMTKLLEDLKN
jgi:hypothetical protein